MDRQLDEALTRGPDPLHLAAVFGLDDKTAIRYADAAKQILQTAVEQHATSSPRQSTAVAPDPRGRTPMK